MLHHLCQWHGNLFLSNVCLYTQALFGILLALYLPNLDPYPGYTVIQPETLDNIEYEALPGGEQICPERHVSIWSSK